MPALCVVKLMPLFIKRTHFIFIFKGGSSDEGNVNIKKCIVLKLLFFSHQDN